MKQFNSDNSFSVQSSYDLFIDGEWLQSTSGESIESINPATGELVTRIPQANADDVDRAVKAAKKAFESWKSSSAIERQSVLLKIADAIEEKQSYFAYLESVETGKPIRETENIDIPLAIDHFRYFAGLTRSHTD